MKNQQEIQRAHDALAGLLLGDVPNPFGGEIPTAVVAATDVLCWVLEHEHNQKFADNLRVILAALEARGYELGPADP